jgi:hypothetical protein
MLTVTLLDPWSRRSRGSRFVAVLVDHVDGDAVVLGELLADVEHRGAARGGDDQRGDLPAQPCSSRGACPSGSPPTTRSISVDHRQRERGAVGAGGDHLVAGEAGVEPVELLGVPRRDRRRSRTCRRTSPLFFTLAAMLSARTSMPPWVATIWRSVSTSPPMIAGISICGLITPVSAV